MKTLLVSFLTITLTHFCHATDLIEKSWFPTINGWDKGEYIDLNTNNTERLYIRYSPVTDNGVELEKTSNNVVLWRTHVQPIIPFSQQVHSKYCHEVNVHALVDSDQIIVISAAGLSVGREGDSIYANSKDAKKVFEIRSLKTGELISRKVSALPAQH
ncbi:MAG TPA: hypothetical protein VKV04_21595 [Verrucomicrobiae bacterium]|nr:hypothetical protein [Verrucomicrobiae bacterium]